MEWDKFPLRVMRHIVIRRFRAAQRAHIQDLIELSVRHDPVGTIRWNDDEIAKDLEMGLEPWKNFRDILIERGIIRVVYSHGVRFYEIAFWVLPDQTSESKGSWPGRRDGRSKEPWPEIPDAELPPTILSNDYAPRSHDGSALSAAERQAVSRARRAATAAGDHFDRDAFLAEYRAARDAKNVTNTPENPGENVTDTSHVSENSGNVTGDQQYKSESIEIENNNIQGETVTPGCHDSQCHDRNDVVVFLSEKGIECPDGELVLITRSVAEALADEVAQIDGSYERLYDQARRLPYRKHDPAKGERAGLYIASVRGTGKPREPIQLRGYGGPPGFDRQQRDNAIREARNREREEAQGRERANAEAFAQRLFEEDRIVAEAEAALQDDVDREAVESETLDRLTNYQRRQYNDARRAGTSPGHMVRQAYAEARRKVLLERALSVPSVPKEPT